MTEYGLFLEDISGNINIPFDVFSAIVQLKTKKVTVYHSSDSHDPKTLEEEIEPVKFGFEGLFQTGIVEQESKLHYLLRTDNDIIFIYFDRDIATYVSISAGNPRNDPGSNFDIFSISLTAKGAVLGQVREAVDSRCTYDGVKIPDTGALLDEAVRLGTHQLNYTTFTEVDPNSHIGLVDTNHIDFDAYKNEDCYLYKDYGVDYFGDFEHKIDVKATGLDNFDEGHFWSLSNNIGDAYAWYDAGLSYVSLKVDQDYAGTKHIALCEGYGVMTYTSKYNNLEDTWYYLTLIKSGTSLTCKIYSDSSRTNLLATLSLTLHANHMFRYLFGCNTVNNGTANACTLDIENLQINEGHVSFTQTQNEYMLLQGDYDMLARLKKSADASDNIATMQVYNVTDASEVASCTKTLDTDYETYICAFTIDALDNDDSIRFRVLKEDVSGNVNVDFMAFAASP